MKIDTTTGEVITWFEAGFYPGEPVFVASPAAKAEDEGALLSIVLDIARDRSFLFVLDAATLKELARAEAPHAIPFHFHGQLPPRHGLTWGRRSPTFRPNSRQLLKQSRRPAHG